MTDAAVADAAVADAKLRAIVVIRQESSPLMQNTTAMQNTTVQRSAAARQTSRLAVVALSAALAVGGCVAEDNDPSVHFGDISLGEQLIDLQKARKAGAISQPEYTRQGSPTCGVPHP